MDPHNFFARAAFAELDGSGAGYFGKDPTTGLNLIRFGQGAPSGTPDAVYYFRTDYASLTIDACIYVNVNGTWTAHESA